MSILNISTSVEYNVGIFPSTLFIQTSDPIATVMGTGYLNGTDSYYGFTYQSNLMCLVSTSDTTSIWLCINIDGMSNISLVVPTAVL